MDSSFDDLPLQESGPPLNAWGQFGDIDELGRLNLITPEVVKRGLEEVKHGIVINLKWVRSPSWETDAHVTVYPSTYSQSLAIGPSSIITCLYCKVEWLPG